MSSPKHTPHGCMRRGFTLFELLVVIAIIGILSGLSIVSFNNINKGTGVRGATNLVSSLVQSARLEAMSQGRGALLVVDAGGTGDQKWRRLAVFRGKDDPSGGKAPVFEMVGRPTYLPSNTFFLPGDSGGYGTMNLPFPGGPDMSVHYYEFTGSGHVRLPPGASATVHDDFRLVFGSGPVDLQGTLVADSARAGRAGVVLRRTGRAVYFEPTN